MAPSRALLRCIASASTHARIRPASRSLFTFAARTPSIRSSPVCLSRPAALSRSCVRAYSQSATPQPPEYLNEAELHVFNKLKAELEPEKLEVQDISGGCGSMYAISIESPRFTGLTVIKQHKLVNQVLKDEIKEWHGVQLKTKAP